MKWKHDDLLYDLAAHLEKPERMMWCDMPMENHGSCRPDIYTLNKSFSSPKPLVYEIKVSVSDYRGDVTSGKWQKYLKYASGVIFCVPKGLITKADLPSGCGLMVRSEKGWRTVKAPTLQKLPEIPVYTWLKLLMTGVEQEYTVARYKYGRSFNEVKVAKEAFSKEVYQVLLDLDKAKRRVEYLDRQYEERERRMHESLEREREYKLATLNKDREVVDKTLKEFEDVFGFKPSANLWGVRNKVEHLYNRCQEDKEVVRLKGIIKDLQQTLLESTKDLFPEED